MKTFSPYLKFVPILLSIIGTIFIGYAVAKIHPWLYMAPILLFGVVMAIYQPDKLMLLIAFFTPLSISLESIGELGGIGFHLPTEPLMFGLLLLLILKAASKRNWDKDIFLHPISLAIYFSLFWIFVTSLTSTMMDVSFKFLLSRLWFIAVCFFFAAHLFKQKEFFNKYVKAFMLGLALVIVITLIKHAQRGFDEQVGHYIMGPYFKDHTSYGAIIAMFLPLSIAFYFYAKKFKQNRSVWLFILLVLGIGIVFSYTRAAWVSLVLALGAYIAIRLRIKFIALLGVATVLIGLFFSFQTEIIRTLERNDQDSSSDFAEHIRSISNISTDASNLERLNRWNCALRMWEEKPVFGWGPGTYMFKYAPFQKFSEKTWISTNRGTLGNAHSEYLGPLSESGVLGMFSFLLIAFMILYTGIRILPRFPKGTERTILLCAILGLITYLGHGVLNNFLDTDKASVPFWGFAAMIMILDIKSRPKESDKIEG
ncbi:MAG: O-antigen ligase family protein [Flavobacteriales bacterium]|nr:O-antigen ligase family protein [Flavobacteriales bacterium]